MLDSVGTALATATEFYSSAEASVADLTSTVKVAQCALIPDMWGQLRGLAAYWSGLRLRKRGVESNEESGCRERLETAELCVEEVSGPLSVRHFTKAQQASHQRSSHAQATNHSDAGLERLRPMPSSA
jgi:hypothetical protein